MYKLYHNKIQVVPYFLLLFRALLVLLFHLWNETRIHQMFWFLPLLLCPILAVWGLNEPKLVVVKKLSRTTMIIRPSDHKMPESGKTFICSPNRWMLEGNYGHNLIIFFFSMFCSSKHWNGVNEGKTFLTFMFTSY